MKKLKEQIASELSRATGEKITPDEIAKSPVADLSSSIAFKLAKKEKKPTAKIADEISKKTKKPEFVEKIEATNGYINFFIDYKKFLIKIISEIRKEKENFGRLDKKGKILLEHTSINPSGPIHVGRIRNSIIGDSLARILKFAGYDVETHYYVNDIGKQIAIINQGFKEKIPVDRQIVEEHKKFREKDDYKIFFQYVSANKKFNEDERFAERVQELIQKAESGDEKALSEMYELSEKCLAGQLETLNRIGIKFDKFDYESKYVKNKEVYRVANFLEKTKYCQTDDGVYLNLADFGLERREGKTILLRADGTSVYLTRDIAYHLEKAKTNAWLINVLGEDHKFEFQELKTILTEIYKLKTKLDVVHFSFVNFEGEELSTRKGKIATVDKLMDEAVEKAVAEIEKRKIAGKEHAADIGLGAVRYHIVKTAPNKPITFTWQQALNFEGEACPYIQYAHARCCSIIRKSDSDIKKIKLTEISELKNEEKELIKILAEFPEVVENSVKDLKPNLVANYVYNLASAFSRFYKECQVLNMEEKITKRRLLLVDSTRTVIKTSLGLLGINAPEKM